MSSSLSLSHTHSLLLSLSLIHTHSLYLLYHLSPPSFVPLSLSFLCLCSFPLSSISERRKAVKMRDKAMYSMEAEVHCSSLPPHIIEAVREMLTISSFIHSFSLSLSLSFLPLLHPLSDWRAEEASSQSLLQCRSIPDISSRQ